MNTIKRLYTRGLKLAENRFQLSEEVRLRIVALKCFYLSRLFAV